MSTPNTYRINVDIKKKMTSTVPTFRQGDTGRLIFKVFDNGRSVDLRRYNRAELYHTLPSGQTVVGDCIVSNNDVTYNYVSPEMAEVGIVQTMLVLYSSEHIISVRPFGVFIYDSMKKENLSYISVLRELISEVQAQKITVTDLSQQVRELLNEVNIEFDKLLNLENEDQRKANEDERIVAENARIQNESNRQSSFTNMQGYVNNIKGVREYSSTTQYYANNIITYNGSSFIALKNNIDQLPPTLPVKVNEFWQLLAQRGVDGSGAVASVNGILPEVNGNIDLSNALVSKGIFDSHSLNIDEDKHIKSVDTLPTDLSDVGFIVKSDEGTVSVPNMTVGDLLEQHVHTYEDDLTTINTNINRKADQSYVNSQVNNITQQLAQIEVNVLDFGAVANVDSTQQIQNAVDFVALRGGGTVRVPSQTFLIKAHVDNQSGSNILNDEGGIALKDNVTLLLEAGAVLKAITNNKRAYNVIRVYNRHNVKIIGGTIQGEYSSHIGTEGEWGYGIAISGGGDIELRDVDITDCWGDGWNLQLIDDGTKIIPKNILLDNVKSYNNRRHAAAIEGGVDITLRRCKFSGTTLYCGLDIEPYVNDASLHGYVVDNVTLENCIFEDNPTNLLIYSNTIRNVRTTNCEFKKAKGQTNVNVAHNPDNVEFDNNLFIGGSTYAKEGVALMGGTNHKLTNNKFIDCYPMTGANVGSVELVNNKVLSKSTQILYAALLSGNDIALKNNTFKSMFDTNNPTAINFGSIYVTAKKILLDGNFIDNVNQGIAVQSSAEKVTLRNNQIINSRAVAITVDSPNIVIEKNIIAGACWNNDGGASVNIGANALNPTIVDNTVMRETIGTQLGTQFAAMAFLVASPATMTGMQFKGNKKQHGSGTNFRLLGGMPTGTGNLVDFNGTAIGTTAQRPSKTQQDGLPFFDTTLNKPIWFNGTVWVDSNGTTV